MILIRSMREEDAPAFREVLDSVARERRYLGSLEAPPLENIRALVSGVVKAGHAQLVADDEGKIVGWCDALPGSVSAGAAHIARLGMGVHPAYRGRKLGRRLLEATIEKVRQAGLEKIELSVYSSNLPAIALYRKLGFVEEGRKLRGRLIDGIYDDVVLMALRLKT
jgi:ribosomal protein S18 acetylase RimI-like enzyme